MLVGVAVGGFATRWSTSPPAAPADSATIFQAVRESVVDIRIADPDRVGSGVVIGPHEIVTARHLVIGAHGSIQVSTGDGTPMLARVVGTDARTDLALLAVDRPLMPVVVADSGNVRVGDPILVVGNPFGLEHSLSVGVVGGTRRRLDRLQGPRVDFMQLSVPLNPGNSGGPVFDRRGRMIGLLTGTHTQGQAIAFAVPSELLAQSLPALRSGRQISRAFFGVRTTDGPDGVLVQSVIPSGPADLAGIRPGDLLSAFDGLSLGSTSELHDQLDALAGDARTTVRLFRDGQLRVMDVQLEDWASQPVVIAGMTLRAEPGSGGQVVAVRPNSRAAHAGIQVTDIVRTVDGRPMIAPAQVRDALQDATSAQLEVDRQGTGLAFRI